MTKTEIWRPENAQVYIYNHVEKEDTTGTVDGVGSSFIATNNIAPISGSYFETNGSALAQYYDASGNMARRDVTVYKFLNGAYTPWNTASDGSVIVQNGSELVFETAPTTAQASKIAATYAHTKAEKSEEVLSVSESGGERAVDFIQTYNGKQIKARRTQQPFSVDIETLKSDLAFSEILNGTQVSEALASGSVFTVSGATTRQSRTLVVDGDDPDTGNRLILCYWNVDGTSKSLDGPAEENFSETYTFQCKAEDSTNIYFEAD